jgi:hypothetical protein
LSHLMKFHATMSLSSYDTKSCPSHSILIQTRPKK